MLARSGPTAITVDHQIAGVHFPEDLDPRRVAQRLAAVNLSDLAAMGARPRYALLALAAPPDYDRKRFFDGLLVSCRRWRFQLAGGDLARSSLLSASLTLIGSRPANGRWVRRSGARPGDRLWCGGTLGESAAGRLLIAHGARPRGRGIRLPGAWERPRALAAAARRAVRRHLLPSPQLELGRWLGTRARAASIDLSDGLARDLHRLCRASGCGASLEGDALPLAGHARRLARRLDRDALQLALAGGEDYVLLFTLPDGERPPPHFACAPIGRLTADPGLQLTRGGATRPLPPLGWDHLESGSD